MYLDGSLSNRWAGDFDIAGQGSGCAYEPHNRSSPSIRDASLSGHSGPSFHRGPSTNSRSIGVSDDDWNEAREELVRLQRGPNHAGSEKCLSEGMRSISGYDLPLSSHYNTSLVGSTSHVSDLHNQHRWQSGFRDSTEHKGDSRARSLASEDLHLQASSEFSSYSGYGYNHGSVNPARVSKQGYEREHSHPYEDHDLRSELSYNADTRSHYDADLSFPDHKSRIGSECRTRTPELAKQRNGSHFDSFRGSRTPIAFSHSYESHGAFNSTRQSNPGLFGRYGGGQSQARGQNFGNLDGQYSRESRWGNSQTECYSPTSRSSLESSGSLFHDTLSRRSPSPPRYTSTSHTGQRRFSQDRLQSPNNIRYHLSGHSDCDILQREDRAYSEGYSPLNSLLYESREGSQAPSDSYMTDQGFTRSAGESTHDPWRNSYLEPHKEDRYLHSFEILGHSPQSKLGHQTPGSRHPNDRRASVDAKIPGRQSELHGLLPTRQAHHTEREQIYHVTSKLDASLHRAFSKNSNVSSLDDFFRVPHISASSDLVSHTPYSNNLHSPKSLIGHQSSINQLSIPQNHGLGTENIHDIRRQADKLATMENNIDHFNKLNSSRKISMPYSVTNARPSFSTTDIDAATFFNELDTKQMELDRQRNHLEKQLSLQASADLELKLASEVKQLDRQLKMLKHYREIDSNRQIAKLSRFGHFLSQAIEPSSKASYLHQPRWLAAARNLSNRTPKLDLALSGGGIAGAYYHLLTNHLPRGLPFFGDRDGFFACGTGRKNVYVRDPFTESIDFDYGYGRMKALGSYGLSRDRFTRINTHLLDDLYLFEMLLRLDRSLDEQERLRRWRERLRWEEILDSRERARLWSEMTMDARRQIGIDEGSFWAAHLFGASFNPRMGYTTCPLAGPAMRARKHYSLTPGLESRYPMWHHGGIGLGRRILNWMDQPYRPINLKHELRRERIRREYAERRGEIRPRPRSLGPGLMGTDVPYQTEFERLRNMSGLHLTGSKATAHPTPSHFSSGSLPRKEPLAASGPSYPCAGLSRSSRPPTPYHAQSHPSPSSRPSADTFQPVSSAMSSGSNSSHLTSSSIQNAGASITINSTSTPKSDRPVNSVNNGVAKSPIDRNLTQSVVFDSYVEKISHEDTIPSRPPSRNQVGAALAPIRSAMKTPPANPGPSVPAEALQDEQQIDSITAINTQRNRSTPAPDEQNKRGDDLTQKSINYDPPKIDPPKIAPPKVAPPKVNPPKVNPAKLASAIKGARKAAEEEKGRLE